MKVVPSRGCRVIGVSFLWRRFYQGCRAEHSCETIDRMLFIYTVMKHYAIRSIFFFSWHYIKKIRHRTDRSLSFISWYGDETLRRKIFKLFYTGTLMDMFNKQPATFQSTKPFCTFSKLIPSCTCKISECTASFTLFSSIRKQNIDSLRQKCSFPFRDYFPLSKVNKNKHYEDDSFFLKASELWLSTWVTARLSFHLPCLTR